MNMRFDTLTLHAGELADRPFGELAQSIHLTSGFAFRSAEHAASLFNLEHGGHTDSRISNPTIAALEERIAALEDGTGAIATASGAAALHLVVVTLLAAGDHLVASRTCDPGINHLLTHALPRLGIDVSMVEPANLDAWAAAIRPETRLLFGAIIDTARSTVLDIPRVSALAHAHRLPLLVDATLVTPYLIQPFAHGADLLIHSAGEFLAGQGTAIGGLLVDSGRFDWRDSGKFPLLTEADDDGIRLADESPAAAFLLHARYRGLRDFGACLGPMSAFQILLGLDTLSLRMRRHMENTARILTFLADKTAPANIAIAHPDQADHPSRALAQRLLPRGAGPVLTIAFGGGRPAGGKFIDALKLIARSTVLGGARSTAHHPASTTHARHSIEQLAALGIDPGQVRLSIGLEDADDLIEDLTRALNAATRE